MTDPQTEAFHRLLADAHHGGQAKVDALVALAQRTVYVVPWPGGIEGYRTLVNSDGVAALPIFSLLAELEEAARRYGWLGADGTAPRAEIGARKAFHYAISQNLTFVVVDIAAEHALEIGREEFQPLMTPAARRDSQGPYAAAGKISSSLIRAVTPAPGTLKAPPAPIEPPASLPQSTPPSAASGSGFTVSKDFDPTAAATFGGGTSATLSALTQVPEDALYDALTALLRGYPEIEWASLCNASRGPGAPVPTVGLRVDTSYRQRMNEIIAEIRKAGEGHGAALDVLLLDDPELMRSARATGVFYPWRKK